MEMDAGESLHLSVATRKPTMNLRQFDNVAMFFQAAVPVKWRVEFKNAWRAVGIKGRTGAAGAHRCLGFNG